MEEGEIIAKRQDKANHMNYGVANKAFDDVDAILADADAKYEAIYQEFKKVWVNNSSISKNDAFKEIGRTYNPDGFLAKHVNRRLVEDGLPVTHKKEVNFEIKESSTTDEFETFYQQFKEIWLANPKISKKEVFKQLGQNQTKSFVTSLNERMEEDGLSPHYKKCGPDKKRRKYPLKNHVEKSEYEQKYQEYKKLFETTDMPVSDIYKKIGVTQSGAHSCGQYIREKAKEDGLDGNARRVKIREKNRKTPKTVKTTNAKKKFIPSKDKGEVEKEYEKAFQEYKHLFLTTELSISEIREKVGVKSYNDDKGKYFKKRCKEEHLNGGSRRKKLENKNKAPAKKSKSKKKKQTPKPKNNKKGNRVGVHNSPGFSDHVKKCVEKSNDIFEKFFADRNIKRATQKGYEATFHRWFDYHGDKYDTIQDCLDLYMGEEDKRIPMRDRSIKKELLGFRESLLEDPGIKSDKSVKSYFSKIGSFFRHFGLEMPTLPQVKLEKGYVSSYNDLPTHAMIKTACEQSPLDLKSLILFMSSSGSAKAETLSITVEMFLTGCNDYLDEPADATNIRDTLKALSDKHDIVPLIYLRRIKTDKWYFTCCSPEASYMIIESLKTRKNLEWTDKLFEYTPSLILAKFQEINDNNNWGYVGAYRRFRSHALRKFMASNIGLPRDQVDSFQGRAKDMIQEAYFKQDPQSLKKIYLEAMHRVMVYENWGHGTTPAEIEQRAKRLKNGFNDNEKILDLSVIPETPEEIKSSVGLGNNAETTVASDKNTRNVQHNSANTMPVTAPVQMPTGMIQGISISKELLQYAELMEKGLLSIGEFNRIKQTLLMSVIR